MLRTNPAVVSLALAVGVVHAVALVPGCSRPSPIPAESTATSRIQVMPPSSAPAASASVSASAPAKATAAPPALAKPLEPPPPPPPGARKLCEKEMAVGNVDGGTRQELFATYATAMHVDRVVDYYRAKLPEAQKSYWPHAPFGGPAAGPIATRVVYFTFGSDQHIVLYRNPQEAKGGEAHWCDKRPLDNEVLIVVSQPVPGR